MLLNTIANLYDEIQNQKNTNKIIANAFIFLLVPFIIILNARTSFPFNGVYSYILLYASLLLFSLFQFNYPDKAVGKQATRIRKIKNISLFYIIFPIVLPFFFSITLLPVTLVTGNNVQNLESVSPGNLPLDLISACLAGLEEVWKLSVIILGIYVATVWVGRSPNKIRKCVAVILSLIVSSFIFGWLHSFGYSNNWFDPKITFSIGILGLELGLVFLLTRRLWVAILVHSMFDINNVLMRFDTDVFGLFHVVVSFIFIAAFVVYWIADNKVKNKVEVL
ncbi:CPBP family glutamic-type intramembrane protease [Paenibacillus lactis]|uniref:CPBP family glutamic-type intramembrane protease n=1 Tax=Paenibacillus lactis TaxID=228574 RepID=UPI003D75FD86